MKHAGWVVPMAVAVVAGAWTWTGTPRVAQEGPSCAPQVDRMEVEGRTSPYDSASVAVGEGMAKICYSAPSLRDRTMIGGENVPYGQIWRTGANEPTTLHVDVPVEIAGIEVGPGSYSIYTIPREGDSWTVIVNRSTSQWGHERFYPDVESQDIGRADVEAEMLDSPVERMRFRPMEDGGGLVLEWQTSRVRIPITPA